VTDPSDLYGLPLERFTEERNALAKQLRADGRRDEAAEVAKLRKPSVSAWAVNQLVRTQKREVEGLFKAGDALQKAQADLLRKRGDPGSLRQAVEAERAAVDQLTDKARGLLSADGHELTPARLEQVSETLHAAALDTEARDQLVEGSLLRELRHVGLGPLSGRTNKPKPKPRTAPKADRKADAQARRELDRAARAVNKAEARRDRAAGELQDAEAALDEANQRLHQAQRNLTNS
jgi:hypothetical protein